jgi:hypothetical protein
MVLPASPQKAAGEMMRVIDDLKKIYELETEALEKHNVKTFMRIQDNKLSAARRYEQGIAQMLERRDEMRSLDRKVKDSLQTAQREFSGLVEKNRLALTRMQRSTGRLVDVIRSAAKEAVEKDSATSYGECGTLTSRQRKSMSVGITETA